MGKTSAERTKKYHDRFSDATFVFNNLIIEVFRSNIWSSNSKDTDERVKKLSLLKYLQQLKEGQNSFRAVKDEDYSPFKSIFHALTEEPKPTSSTRTNGIAARGMRLHNYLRIPARVPQNERTVKFEEILPLKLKPFVSGKGGKSTNVACIQEMAIMFACFKANEFNQDSCSKEIETFQKCYKVHTEEVLLKKSQEQKGILTPGEKKTSGRQLNRYLKKFPPN